MIYVTGDVHNHIPYGVPSHRKIAEPCAALKYARIANDGNRHEDPTQGGSQGVSASGGEADWNPVLAQSLDGCGDFYIRYEVP